MKRLIAISLTTVLTLGLVAGDVMALTQPSVSLDDDEISMAGVEYTIVFTIAEDVAEGKHIVVEFPNDTDISRITNTDTDSDVTVAATSGTGSTAFNATAAGSSSADTTLTITLPDVNAEDKIGTGATVQVVVSGVVNPSVPGDYTLKVKTSEETTYVESESYEIEVPVVGGFVYVYNASDILIATYGGSAALNDAEDDGYFGRDDWTITVGPGTYVLGGDLAITGKGLTLESSEDAADTIIDADGNGLQIAAGGEDVVIDGFTIEYADEAILISADGVTVTNNIITDASVAGIEIVVGIDATVSDNVIEDCAVGIYLCESSNNTVSGNTCNSNLYFGIFLSSSSNNTISGNTCNLNGHRGIHLQESSNSNTLSGNTCNSNDYGIYLYSSSSNAISGNICNSNASSGIYLSSSSSNAISGNTCNSNSYHGIRLYNSSNNTITSNTTNDNNYGIRLYSSSNNTIGGTTASVGNTIAFNGGDGVVVEVGIGNAIQSNSIFSNAGLGIDLGGDGMMLNDLGDTDSGANNLQNYPVLTSATSGSGSSITIEGTLNSTPNTKFRLEFFANTECDPSGYGEGETFLGFIDVTTDGSGNVAFTVTFPDAVPGGHFITATATDPNSNTSEFSQCLQVTAAPAEVWVDDDYAPGEYNDGHTWGYDAFAKIQDGMDAVAGSTVHVAAGYYVENITLEDGVQVLGAGADITTINGGGAGSVVTAIGVGSETVLDGFTITGGVADVGGGMYNYESSPAVTNCTFSNNSAGWGGGMYNGRSSPTVTDCTFYSNSAINGGGGMYNHDNSPATVANCIFSSNSASWGGGMQNHVSSPTVINCIFCDNSVTAWGGGMNNAEESSPTVTNCTFSSNSANIGGSGMSNGESSPTVTNCILWDNGEEIAGVILTTVTYCDVQGEYTGEGNIDADPMFVDPSNNDYHLKISSPCIDKGTDVGAPTEDIEGNPRPIDGDIDGTATTDIGAYEYVPPAEPAIEATVDFDPDTLNLKSKGKVVTVYIELPEGYDVEKTDVSTVMLNSIVPALAHPTDVGDYDSDGVLDLMVKFDRSNVQDMLEPGNEVEVTVSGQLTDGTSFEGADTIRVIEKEKK